MIYKSKKNEKKICTFLSESLREFYGEDYEEIELIDSSTSSSSLSFKFKGDTIFRIKPYSYFSLSVEDNIVIEVDNQMSEAELFCNKNSFVVRIVQGTSGTTYCGDIYACFINSTKGLLVFTLTERWVPRYINREGTPFLIQENSNIPLEKVRPICFFSNYIGTEGKGEYYSSSFDWFSPKIGLIKTDMKAIAGEMGYLGQENKMVLPDWLIDIPYSFRIPMSLVLFDEEE